MTTMKNKKETKESNEYSKEMTDKWLYDEAAWQFNNNLEDDDDD